MMNSEFYKISSFRFASSINYSSLRCIQFPKDLKEMLHISNWWIDLFLKVITMSSAENWLLPSNSRLNDVTYFLFR